MTTIGATRRLWSIRPARATSRKPIAVGRRTTVWLARVEDLTHRWRTAIERWWRARDDIDAFRTLDAHARRDLGVDLCEAASFGSEAEGLANRTRRRVAWRSTAGKGVNDLPEL